MDGVVTLYTVSQEAPENYQPFQYYLDYTGDEAIQTAKHYLGVPPEFACNAYIQKGDGSTFWLDMTQTLRAQGLEQGNVIGLQYIATPQIDLGQQMAQPVQQEYFQQIPGVEPQYMQPNDPYQMQQVSNFDPVAFQSPELNSVSGFMLPEFDSSALAFNSMVGDFSAPSWFQSNNDFNDAAQFATGMFANINFNFAMQEPDSLQVSQSITANAINMEDAEYTIVGSTTDEYDFNINSSIADFNSGLGWGAASGEGGPGEEFTEDVVTIQTFMQFKEPGTKVIYRLSDSPQEALSMALMTMGKDQDEEFALLIIGEAITDDGTPESNWFDGDKLLSDFQPNPKFEIHIFPKYMPVTVHTQHYNSHKLNLDITKKVGDLVGDVAQELNLDSFHCFTLCSLETQNTPKYMSIEKSIPEQTKYLKEVLFIRQYYLFTVEDITTMEQAIYAFEDAKELANKSSLELRKEEILRYAALNYVATNKGKTSDVPDDVSPYLPDKYAKKGRGAGKGEHVQKFIDKYKQYFDHFNAIKNFIGFLRHIPGFASQKFECHFTTKFRGEDVDLNVVVEINPYRLNIYNRENGMLEENVSYSEIIYVQCVDTLDVRFAPGPSKNALYQFECNKVEQMYKLISRYREITNRIYTDRAKKYANKGDFQSLITEKGTIYLGTTTDLSDANIKEYRYDKKFTGGILRKAAENYLNIPEDENHVCLIHLVDTVYRWAKEDDILQTYSLQDGMVVYILDRYKEIRIHYPDDTVKTVRVDITLPIEEITKFLFKKARLPVMLGYTLWWPDSKKNLVPLDFRLTLPEQVDDYKELYFRRRFYVLSAEVLQSTASAVQTVIECKKYIEEQNYKLDDNQLINLGMNYLYAIGTRNIRKGKFDLQEYVPKANTISQSLNQEFNHLLNDAKDTTQLSAAKKYIALVRGLPDFGVEKFKFSSYRDDFGKGQVIKKGYLFIGPFGVQILDPNEKPVFERIPYRQVKSYSASPSNFKIIFAVHRHTVTGFIRIRDSSQVDMMITYNIKLNHDLQILNKERKMEQALETALRLSGGWKDEQGRVHGPMLDFRIGVWGDPQLKETTWFDLETPQPKVLETSLIVTNLDQKEQWATLVQVVKGVNKWLLPDMILSDVHPYRDAIIYVHPAKLLIKFIVSDKRTKVIEIITTKTVEELIPMIGDKFKIKNTLGYALFAPERKEKLRTLDNYKTITEQINKVADLYFRRFFFVISKSELEDPDSLLDLYYDVKQLVLEGKVDMKLPLALELAYYSIVAEHENPSTSHIAEDLSTMLPAGMQYHKKSRNEIVEMLKKNQIKTTREGMLKYINAARALPTFGATKHNCTFIQRDDKKVAEIPAVILVGPSSVFVVGKARKEQLAEAEYRHYIRTEFTDSELLIKSSSDKDTASQHILVRASDPSIIATFVTKHINIIQQLLHKRVSELDLNADPVTSKERVILRTSRGWKIKENDPIQAYDMRYSGTQVLARARKHLKLTENISYSPLLQLTDDEFRWIAPDDLLGNYFPCDYMILQIFPTLVQLKVHLENQPTVTVTVDITKPLHELISQIADRLFIDYAIGYTLWIERPNKSPLPLDLCLSIPEQVAEPTDFLVKRRFFSWTKEDRQQDFVVRSIYPDVKANVLSGIPTLQDSRPQELAIYSIYAENQGIKDPQALKIPDVKDLFPSNTKSDKINMDNIKKYIRTNPVMKQLIALKKYILVAKNCNNFGSEIFNCTIYDDVRIKTPADIKIAIGPIGVGFQGSYMKTNSDGTETPAKLNERISYQYIHDYFLMVDHVTIRVSQANGKIRSFQIQSRKAKEIFSLLKQYIEIINKIIKARERLQAQNEDFKKKITGKIDFPIKIPVTRRLDHPNPPQFKFGRNFTGHEIMELSLYYFALPQEVDNWCLLYRSEKIENEEAKKVYHWFRPTQKLQEYNPAPGDLIILLPLKPSVTVETEHGLSHTFNLDVTQPVLEHTKETNEFFKIGSNLGFTFYDKLEDDSFHPLDFTRSIPTQTQYFNNIMLRRRFFIFTYEMFDDPESVMSIYMDTKLFIVQGKLVVNVEKAIDLAILSLYAETDDTAKVLEKANSMKVEQIQELFPKAIDVDQNLAEKFSKAVTVQPPLDKINAAKAYINNTMMMPGYGEELYDVRYTYIEEMGDSQEDDGRISVSPRSILILTNQGQIIGEIFYPFLSEWNLYDKNKMIPFTHLQDINADTFIQFDYTDFSAMHYTVRIESKQIENIASYVSNLLEILGWENIGHIIDYNQGLNFNREVHVDETYLLDEDFFHHNFDNIETIEINLDHTFKIDLDDDDYERNFTFNVNTNFNEQEFNEDAGDSIMDDDLEWRANPDGLQYQRTKNLLDMIELELKISPEDIEKLNPTQFFQQLATLNDSINQFTTECTNDDLRDRFLNIRTSIDTLCDTTQNIVQNDQEIRPFVDIIHTQLAQALQFIPVARSQSDWMFDNFKVQIKEKSQQITTGPNRKDMPELSKSLIMISDAQESIADTLLRNSGLLKIMNIDTIDLQDRLRNTSATLTRLSATLTEQKNLMMIAPHLIPQVTSATNALQEIQEILDTVKANDVSIADLGEAQTKLRALLAAAQKQIREQAVNQPELTQRRAVIIMGNDNSIPETIAGLEDIPTSSIKELPEAAQGLTNTAIDAIEELKKNLTQLKLNQTSEAARLEAIASLHRTSDSVKDALVQLRKIGLGTVQDALILKLSNIEKLVANELDLVSTKNITPVSVAKVNDDLTYMLNFFARMKPSAVAQLNENDQMVLNKLKDYQFNLAQQQSALMANTIDPNAVSRAQSILIQLKQEFPDISISISHMASIANDAKLPIIIERLDMNINKSLTDPIVQGENLSACEYVLKMQEANYATANLLNELANIKNLPSVAEDQELAERCARAIEMSQKAYLDLNDIRNDVVPNPFSRKSLDSTYEVIIKNVSAMNEIKVLAHRVADVAQNVRIDQLTDDIIANYNAVIHGLDNAHIDVLPDLNSKEPTKIEKVVPTSEDAQKVLDSLSNMIQIASYLAGLPEVTADPALYNGVSADYHAYYAQYNDVQAMLANPNESIYPIIQDLIGRSQNMHNIAMSIPSYANTPNSSESIPSIITHVQTIKMPPMKDESEVVVSFEDVKKSLKDSKPTIKKLLDVIKDLRTTEDVKGSRATLQTLDDWTKSLESVLNKIEIHSTDANYTKQMAMNDKEALLVAQRKMVVIPLKVRQTLQKDQIEDLTPALEQFNTAALGSIALIRNLPRSKKIELKKFTLPHIEIDTEVDDLVGMLVDYSKEVNKIIDIVNNLPQVHDSSNALNLINQMKQSFTYIDYEALRGLDEEDFMEKLVSIHNTVPALIASAEILQPLLDNDALTVALKGFNDLANSSYKMISVPHMNTHKSAEFQSQILPHLQYADQMITEAYNIAEIKTNVKLVNQLRGVHHLIKSSITELPTLKPRLVQTRCDDIYGSVCQVLPSLYDAGNFDNLERGLHNLGFIAENYTALPTQRKGKTEILVYKDKLIEDQALKHLVESLKENLTSDLNEFTNELKQNIKESLKVIHDHQNSVPPSVTLAVNELINLINRNNDTAIIPAAKVINNVSNNYDERTENQAEIALSSTVAASMQLLKMIKAMKYLQDQIHDNARKFGSDVFYYTERANNNIKDADAKLLVECQTLPAAILNIDNLHKNRADIALVLQSLEGNELVKGIVQPLEESLVTFSNNVHAADSSFASILLNNLERIACPLDKMNIVSPQTSSQEMLNFLTNIIPIIRSIDRQRIIGRQELMNVCKIYKDFVANVYGTINFIKSKYQKPVDEAIKALEKYKNMIDMYAEPPTFSDRAEAVSHLLATSVLAKKSLVSVAQDAQQNPESAGTVLSPTADIIDELVLTHSIAEQYGFKDEETKAKITEASQKMSKIYKETSKHEFGQTAQDVTALAKVLNDLIVTVNGKQEIDFESADSNINFKDVNAELYLSSITDQSCYNLALQSNQILQNLKTQMMQLKQARVHSGKQSQNVTEILKKQSTQSALAASSLSIALNPTLAFTSLDASIIAPSVIQSMEYGAVYAAAVPILQQPKLSESNTRLLISQRLEALRQKELTEFPDTVKMLSSKQSFKFTPDEITDAVMSIQSLLNSFDEGAKIEEALSRLTPSQVLVQQHVLKFALDGIKNNMIDTGIVTSNEGLSANKLNLLEAAAHKQAQNPSKLNVRTVNDVNNAIVKNMAIVNVLESLISITQQQIAEVPELCRFINTPEGQSIFKSPLDAGQIIEAQQQVLRQVALADSQENLAAYTRTFTPAQLINQQRIISHTVSMLTADDVYTVINDPNVGTTPMEILKAANLKVQDKLKNNEENNKQTALIETDNVSKLQEFCNDMMERLLLAQALMTVQATHDAALPGLHQQLEAIDVAQPINGQFLEQLVPILKTEIEYCNSPQQFAEVLAQMKPEDIQSQQPYIAFLAGALTTLPRNELCSASSVPFKSSADDIIERITNSVTDILTEAPELLTDVDPISSETNFEDFTNHLMVLNSCMTATNMERIISQIRANNAMIDQVGQAQNVQQVFSSFANQDADKVRENLLVLYDLANQSTEELDQAVKQLSEQEIHQSYCMLVTELLRVSNIDNITQKVKARSAETRIFDRSLLIQSEPQKGIAQQPIASVLPDVQAIDAEVLEEYKNMAKASFSSSMTRLAVEYNKALNKPLPQIQELVVQQQGKFDLAKLNELEQMVYQQIYTIGQDEPQVLAQISQMSDEDKVLTQSLIMNISQLAESAQYMDAVCTNINFLPADLDDPKVIDQTNIVSAATIAMNLIQYQQQMLQQSTDFVTQMPLPSAAVLEKNVAAAKEIQNRTLITSKLATLQKQLLTKSLELQGLVEQSKQNGSVKINITPELLVQLQGEVKSLVSTSATASRIVPLAAGGSDDNIKRLAVINNLVSIVKPQTTVITPITGLENFQSIFDDKYNAATVPVSVSSIVVNKPRTQLMATASAAQTAAGLLPILAQFSSLPISECFNIFSSENTEAIKLIQKLMTPISQQDRDLYVQQLADLTPQLTASLARVMTTIDNAALKERLVKDVASLVQVVNEIQISSVDLKNQENLLRYRQMCSMMLQMVKNLDAGIVQPKTAKFEIKPLNALANVCKSLQAKDIERIHTEIIELSAMKTASVALNLQEPILDAQLATLSQIEQYVQNYYISGNGADSNIVQLLEDSEKKTVDLINSQTQNPFKMIDAISTPAQVVEVFDASRKSIDTATSNLISAINNRDSRRTNELISDIIKSVSDSQAAMFRGIDITATTRTPVYTDYMQMIHSSMSAMNSIVEIGKSSAVSSTQIKRATRSFNRLINSLQDIIEEPERAKEEQKQSKLDAARLDFVKNLAHSAMNVITAVSTNATSKIPESFNAIMQQEKPRLDSSLAALSTSFGSLVSINTDASVSSDFTNEFNQLYSSFNMFNDTISAKAPSLERVTQLLVRIVDNVSHTVNQMDKLTDVVQRVPDMENAEKLPKGFTLPPVPDTSNTTIQTAVPAYEQSVQKYSAAEAKFYKTLESKKVSNKDLVDAMLPFHEAIKNLTESLLGVSATVLSLEGQRQLTSFASTISTSFDALLNSLRDRFLLKGDFDVVSQKSREEIKNAVTTAIAVSRAALKRHEEEQRQYAAVVAKYTAVTTPLTNYKARLEQTMVSVQAMPTTMASELATTMIKPCQGISQALQHLYLFSKDHDGSIRNADAMIQAGTALNNELIAAQEAINKIVSGEPQPEAITAAAMKKVAESIANFIKVTETKNTDAKKLLDIIGTFGQACGGIARTSEEALAIKKQRAERQAAGIRVLGGAKAVPKASMMKRLELESRVIKARMILERSEKLLAAMS